MFNVKAESEGKVKRRSPLQAYRMNFTDGCASYQTVNLMKSTPSKAFYLESKASPPKSVVLTKK